MSYQALLFCPDEATAQVVTQVLTELDFAVEPSNEPFAAVKKLMAQHYDALVVDCENEQNAALLFKSARNSSSNQSSLAVAVVDGQAGVAKAFRIGANLVLTKPINVEQSKGTLRVARGLLRKGDKPGPAGDLTKLRTPVGAPSASPVTAAPVAVATAASKPAPAFAPRMSTPATTVAKPAFAPVATKATPTAPLPVASTSTFEVEQEPAPVPDEAEAALLESMSETLPAPAAPAAPQAKEYPWQAPSKSATTMTASVMRSAETLEQAAPTPAASATTRVAPPVPAPKARPTDSQKLKLGLTPKISLGTAPQAAASAPNMPAVPTRTFEPAAKPRTSVPAAKTQASVQRPDPKPTTKHAISEPVVAEETPVPHFATAHRAEPAKAGGLGTQKITIMALAAVVIIAVGYIAWIKTHPSAPTTQVAQETSTATTVAPSATTVVEPKPSDISNTTSSASGNPGGTDPRSSKSSTIAKPTNTHTPHAQEETAPEPSTSRQSAVLVKNSGSASSGKTGENSQAAPMLDPLNAGAGAGDNRTLAGIVSGGSVRMPKSGETLRISQGISQGLLIKKVAPSYPPQAIRMRIQGAVTLEAKVGKDGSIADVKQISGNASLGQSAMEAVRKWKYKPYLLNGQPVEIWTQVTVNFQLP